MLRMTNKLFIIRVYFRFYGMKNKTFFVKQKVGRKLGCVENDLTLCLVCFHRLTKWISRVATALLSYYF